MVKKTRLTVAVVKSLLPEARDLIVWDAELTGLHVKVTPAGRKSFFLYYRTPDGRERRPKLGDYPTLKPEAARQLALQMKADVLQGRDPSAARKAARAEKETVSSLLDRYLVEHAERHKKLSSALEDRRLVERVITPLIGELRLDAVKAADITALMGELSGTPIQANRSLALLSKAFALAELWGLRLQNTNPTKGVRRFREQARGHFLDDAELGRLWQVLDQEDQTASTGRSATSAIRLLLLTGRRLGEVLTLEWSHIDFENGVLKLPDSKTGRITVPLPSAAATLLQNLRAGDASDPKWVIPGQKPGTHLVNLQKPWRRIRNKAGLDHVRLHDLRHSYASQAIALGLSLTEVGGQLAHKSPLTTQRYAHLSMKHKNAMAAQVDERLSEIVRWSQRAD